MHRYTYIFTLVALLFISRIMAVNDSLNVGKGIVTDSLLKSIEQDVRAEYGISDNSSLAETAHILKLDLKSLKKQLGLDVDNSKLDKMKLRQIGISVYNVILAQETLTYGFNDNYTIAQISRLYAIPIKKLKTLLGLETNNSVLNNQSLLALNITPDLVLKAKQKYDDSTFGMSMSIVLVGMIVVFIALLISAIVISQLRHLNIEPKAVSKNTDIKMNPAGQVISVNRDISEGDIIAVITSLHLFMHNLEERRKINMKFHRNGINYWHISGITEMPNRRFYNKQA